MIKRIWYGWTTHESADEYETLLKTEVIPGIEAKAVPGYHGIELLRRSHENEVEFITIMTFDSLAAVKLFAGEDHTKSYVPAAAQDILSRWDEWSRHYEVRESLSY